MISVSRLEDAVIKSGFTTDVRTVWTLTVVGDNMWIEDRNGNRMYFKTMRRFRFILRNLRQGVSIPSIYKNERGLLTKAKKRRQREILPYETESDDE